MTVMTSREFNQYTSLAQKHALSAPVIITNRGKPMFVLVKYEEYQQTVLPKRTIADALVDLNAEAADIEFELQPRSRAQRPPVDFGEL